LQAAAYAETFIAELARKQTPAINGHVVRTN
jgi:hypothetical protein